jgi:hypothetical protein
MSCQDEIFFNHVHHVFIASTIFVKSHLKFIFFLENKEKKSFFLIQNRNSQLLWRTVQFKSML